MSAQQVSKIQSGMQLRLAADAPAYVAPPPTGDPKSTIVSGILMIVNGVIMAEADRRHQDCATFASGLDPRGFPMFRHACRIPDNNTRKTGVAPTLSLLPIGGAPCAGYAGSQLRRH
jgi:hypothetical protein